MEVGRPVNVARVSLSKLYTSVRIGFMIEMYGFTHGLHIFPARAANCAIVTEDFGDRRRRQARERVQRYRRWSTAQQWDERRQDNSDRRP